MQKQIWVLVAVPALAHTTYGQTSRGAVSGTVTDPAGAVISRASILLTNTRTGIRRSSSSNEVGIYRFDAVDPGPYELKISQSGFKALIATDLGVEANRTLTFDPRLEVGGEAIEIQVSALAETMMTRDGPLRGGNFLPREVSQLPLLSLNPLSLARTLPGVVQPAGTALIGLGGGEAVEFSVNGQRLRGNNFLLDGTENNDIAFTGVAQPFNIADAVEEVAIQTANFSVEFGRASGGVFNVVTKSGSNQYHGTVLWRYRSQRFESASNVDKLNQTPKSVFNQNVAAATAGGPLRKDKTFFFAAFQQDVRRSTANFPLVVPTAAAVERLLSLFPSNPRLNLYLNALGDLRGSASPLALALGPDPQTGANRGQVQFATAPLALPQSDEGPQWLFRFDQQQSNAHRFTARYIRDSKTTAPVSVLFPGFITDTAAHNHNFLFADSYTFGPSYLNEFRFSYGRLDADQSRISPMSVPLAQTLPQMLIQNVSAPGVPSGLQFRYANNLLFQETQTKVSGRHTLRYGAELLRQLATQKPNGYPMGEYTFLGGSGYSAFANFLDDFSGPSGRIRKTIGGDIFYPNQFRQSYFFQDTWKTTQSLTITLGLRYENFGQPANSLRYPAFTGFDPVRFFEPNQVNRDDRNLGPAVGIAWSPALRSGWLASLFGAGKTVWRSGYQISYQPLHTQILSLDLATSTPNAITVDLRGEPTGRGTGNWFAQLPTATPRTPSILDTQYGTLDKNLRNPYTERWSFGFERELPDQTLLDLSYVGSEGHHLTTRADVNPGLDGARLHPDFGPRTIRTSDGNSNYHSLQARVERRFRQHLHVNASYTWSKSIDSTSEGIGQVSNQYASSGLTSIPLAVGGMKLDRAVSDFDRTHRMTLLYIWDVPGPSNRFARHVLAGWSIAGITTFQSGTPFTIINGSDRNKDGWDQMDRPDIGNPYAPRNSRAVLWPTIGPQACGTGYRDPDANTCVKPSEVYWVEGTGSPNASTVGRNTLRTGGTSNFDVSLFKTFQMGEHRRLEFRWEAQNAFNHPQFTTPPAQVNRSVRDAVPPQGNLPSRFLNQDFTNAGLRSMWVQMKLLF